MKLTAVGVITPAATLIPVCLCHTGLSASAEMASSAMVWARAPGLVGFLLSVPQFPWSTLHSRRSQAKGNA